MTVTGDAHGARVIDLVPSDTEALGPRTVRLYFDVWVFQRTVGQGITVNDVASHSRSDALNVGSRRFPIP